MRAPRTEVQSKGRVTEKGLGTGEEDKTRSLPLERESGDRVEVGKQQN